MPRKAAIVANGLFKGSQRELLILDDADIIVCADGGADHLRNLGVPPGIIIGDLDSINPVTLEAFPDTPVVEDKSQDKTDIVKALEYLISDGWEDITILGALGARQDLTITNISLLSHFDSRATLRIVDGGTEIYYVASSVEFNSPPRRKISLLTFDRPTRLTTEGLRWEYSDTLLEFGSEGISNEVVTTPFKIKASDGVFVFLLDEFANGTPFDG